MQSERYKDNYIRYRKINLCQQIIKMLATVDANKFIKALHAYNQSLKSPLNLTEYINKNNDLTTDLFTQEKLNAMFEIKSAKKGPKSSSINNKQEKKDFVSAIRFFKDLVEPDKLLAGLDYQYGDRPQYSENFVIDLTRVFRQKYMVGKVVGQGAYASVRVAIQKENQQKVAIKVYQKSKISRFQRKKSIQRQIRILTALNHKNIVKIIDVIQTNNHLNIVMQYLPGTPLSEHLKKKQNRKMPQQECKQVIKGLAEALVHMKSLNISHRDIKIENVILDQKFNPKLIDFGFSTCVETGKKMQLFCGTPNYMAPEIVLREQFCGLKSDIWALGVLFFVIATGVYPFKGATDQQLYKKITHLDYPLYLLDSNYKMTELLKKMLQLDPQSRITPQQIINHPWLRDENKYYICTTKSQKKQSQIGSPHLIKKQRINTTVSALSNYKENKQQKPNKQIQKQKQKSSLLKEQKKISKLRESLNNTLKPKNMSSNSKSKTQITKNSKQKSKVKIQKITYEKSLKKMKIETQQRKLSRSKSKAKLN